MVEAAISATENRRATVFTSENLRERNGNIWIQQVKLAIFNFLGCPYESVCKSWRCEPTTQYGEKTPKEHGH